MSRATFAVSLSMLLLLEVPASAQSLAQGKARFDAADYPAAATSFLSTAASGSASERAEAAAFALRSLSQAGDHAKVSAEFARCVEIAAGTNFEAECYLEYGKSLQNNAKDTTGALEQYAAILKRWPDNVFAASGALLQRGVIELDDLKSPNTALATFEESLSRYPSSSHVPNVVAMEAKTGLVLADLKLIEKSRDRLDAMKAAPILRQSAQFQCGEYHNKISGERERAIHEYCRVFREIPERTRNAALAKVRAADLVVRGDFEESLNLYRSVLNDHPGVDASIREWADCQAAIYEYQLGEVETARQHFEDLLTRVKTPKLRAMAQRYVTGIDDPDSPESVVIHYDRGIRFRQIGMGFDEAFMEMQEVLRKTRAKGPVSAFLADTRQPKEERAQMRYRACFAMQFSGRSEEAFKLAGEILEQEMPDGVTKSECLYMRAYLFGKSNEWGKSAEAWGAFFKSNPNAELLPNAYLEYSRSLENSGDRLEAILMLQELIARFPNRKEAASAKGIMGMLFHREPGLRPAFEVQKPLIAAKWKPKPKTELASDPEEGMTGIVALAGGAE